MYATPQDIPLLAFSLKESTTFLEGSHTACLQIVVAAYTGHSSNWCSIPGMLQRKICPSKMQFSY